VTLLEPQAVTLLEPQAVNLLELQAAQAVLSENTIGISFE
jgi:hypothetical protein